MMRVNGLTIQYMHGVYRLKNLCSYKSVEWSRLRHQLLILNKGDIKHGSCKLVINWDILHGTD